jgi:hypothetical protein
MKRWKIRTSTAITPSMSRVDDIETVSSVRHLCGGDGGQMPSMAGRTLLILLRR